MTTTIVQEQERSQIAEEYKWNSDDVYPGVDAWRKEKQRIAEMVPSLSAFAGRLTSSAATLADLMEQIGRAHV